MSKKKNKVKWRIPEWDKFKRGDIVEMKGCFFAISHINPTAKHIILLGIKDPRKREIDITNPPKL